MFTVTSNLVTAKLNHHDVLVALSFLYIKNKQEFHDSSKYKLKNKTNGIYIYIIYKK